MVTPTDQTLVSIRNVSFAYAAPLRATSTPTDPAFPDANPPALFDISLDIPTGTTVGVIGPNGGGKTTLLHLLLGNLEPDRGTITIAGMSPRQAVRKGGIIGYLPQNVAATAESRGPSSGPGSYGGGHGGGRLPITVRQAVRLGLAGKTGLLRPYAKPDLDFADHLIDRVGLPGLHDAPLHALSGGQLQRACIARALVPRPRLLLLDEPTTGVDRGSQQRLIELLAELKQQLSLTVVLVSHDLRAVTQACDRIACLNTTLHYHDVPHSFPEHLAQSFFCCDLEAMGLGHGHGDTHHHCPAHDHCPTCSHAAAPAPLPAEGLTFHPVA